VRVAVVIWATMVNTQAVIS